MEEGAKVVITYNKNFPEDLTKRGIVCYKCDVSNREEVRQLSREVRERVGEIDVLVNNAGIMYSMPFESYDEGKFDEMIKVNIKGVIYVTLEFLEDLKHSMGSIINISSIASIGTALIGSTYYAITKAGVSILTKRLSFELGKYGIRVNAVAPGWIQTDLTLGGKSEEERENLIKAMSSRTSLNLTGKPEDISRVVLFLASDEAKFITGQVIAVDGGRLDYITHST